MTHDDVALAALRWLLARPWCRVATTEVAYVEGRLDVVGASGLDAEHALWRDEHRRRAEGADLRRAQLRLREHPEPSIREKAREVPVRPAPRRGLVHQPPMAGVPRVGVIEAKATRADLLSDLRAGKMATYTDIASQCWVALRPRCLLEDEGPDLADRCRARITPGPKFTKIPAGWGVLLVVGPTEVLSIRPAAYLRDVAAYEVAGWTARMARSMAYRATPTGLYR